MSETGDLSQILAFFQSKPGPLPGDGEYDAALCGRVVAAAARLSGIPRKTFAFRLKKRAITESGSPR